MPDEPLDLEDNDEPVVRVVRKKKPAPAPAGSFGKSPVTTIICLVTWAGLLVVIIFAGLGFAAAMSKADNAIKECAVGAVFSTVMIGFYIAARCVEKITALADRSRETD